MNVRGHSERLQSLPDIGIREGPSTYASTSSGSIRYQVPSSEPTAVAPTHAHELEERILSFPHGCTRVDYRCFDVTYFFWPWRSFISSFRCIFAIGGRLIIKSDGRHGNFDEGAPPN
jgi:hypothetical protein